MLRLLENMEEMGFLFIEEAFPDDYILVKIVEINHSIGKETGIALCVSADPDELVDYRDKEGLEETATILQGTNLIPVLGGLL